MQTLGMESALWTFFIAVAGMSAYQIQYALNSSTLQLSVMLPDSLACLPLYYVCT